MTSRRRSLYLRHAQEKRAVFLKVFDSPSANDCYRRIESVMPQQALALANSPLAHRTAATRLAAELSKGRSRGRSRSSTRPSRPCSAAIPTDEERAACAEFLDEQAGRLATPAHARSTPAPMPPSPASADPRQRAREGLVHVLFNHNDFVTIR